MMLPCLGGAYGPIATTEPRVPSRVSAALEMFWGCSEERLAFRIELEAVAVSLPQTLLLFNVHTPAT